MKNKNSWIYWLILGLVVLIIAGITYYLFWYKEKISYDFSFDTKRIEKDEYADWKEFNNTDYGYTIKYPSTATLTLASDDEAQKAGLLSGQACVTISTEYGHVIIAAREVIDVAFSQSDAFFLCMRTGVGQASEPIEERVIIEGKEYQASGFYTKAGFENESEEFFGVILDDGIKFEYGVSKINKESNPQEYKKTKEEVLKIVKSYHRVADYSWDTYYSTQAKITFQFPEGWEVREDYFYKDSSFRTIVLCQKEEPQGVDANCVQINMPQAPTGTKHEEIEGNWINIYTDDPQVVACFDKIVGTFETIE